MAYQALYLCYLMTTVIDGVVPETNESSRLHHFAAENTDCLHTVAECHQYNQFASAVSKSKSKIRKLEVSRRAIERASRFEHAKSTSQDRIWTCVGGPGGSCPIFGGMLNINGLCTSPPYMFQAPHGIHNGPAIG